MKYISFILVVVISLTILGCGGSTEIKEEKHFDQPQNGSVDTSEPDWMNKTIQEKGEGAVDPNKAAMNPASAKLMAKRAAEMDAKRRLLERVLGLNLSSSTVVKDFVTQSDDINAATSGFVRNTRMVGEHFDGSIYYVTLELKLHNVYMYMKTKKIYYK